jgi:hypothetical protein
MYFSVLIFSIAIQLDSFSRLFKFFFPCFFLIVSFYSCKKDSVIAPYNNPSNDTTGPFVPAHPDTVGYDILLIAGQSNTHSGLGIEFEIDQPDSLIFQLGRFENDNKIIPAREPLDHYTKNSQKIGFALEFAKLYRQEFLTPPRKVLIIPCGMGDTGFRKQRWNKENDLYQDAVNRVNMVLKEHPRSKMGVR